MSNEKLCIDVRGFSEEKKKRVQDAFFELGIEWLSGGQSYKHISDDDSVYIADKDLTLTRGDYDAGEPNTTYPELMRKAGMDEGDPDSNPWHVETIGVDHMGMHPLTGMFTLEAMGLHETIKSYLAQLEGMVDTKARELVVEQLTDLLNLEYKALTDGESK